MSFQNNDSSDLDFSIIDKKPPQQSKLNFSVESLLSQHPASQPSSRHSSSTHRNHKSTTQNQQYDQQVHEVNAQNGSFLNDLQKMQHQLSFQTLPYNVYQQQTQFINSNSLNPANKSSLHAKSNSHLKTTKQQSLNSRTLQLDDYGYLVIDFGTIGKRIKSSKLSSSQKTHHNKLYTQQGTTNSQKGISNSQPGTSNSQKLKLSGSSATLTQNASITTITSKSKHKNSSLNKLLSPRLTKNNPKSLSKDKDLFKVFKNKTKDTKKQLKHTLDKMEKTQKTQKTLSKPKSIQKLLNNSKRTNISTTLAQTSNKRKSSTKSTRQANAYSQYYGFEQMGDSQRLVMKSNCLYTSGSEKKIVFNGRGNSTYLVKKSSSKSKCKQSFHSPSGSSKDLTMRFKKKKTKQVN